MADGARRHLTKPWGDGQCRLNNLAMCSVRKSPYSKEPWGSFLCAQFKTSEGCNNCRKPPQTSARFSFRLESLLAACVRSWSVTWPLAASFLALRSSSDNCFQSRPSLLAIRCAANRRASTLALSFAICFLHRMGCFRQPKFHIALPEMQEAFHKAISVSPPPRGLLP